MSNHSMSHEAEELLQKYCTNSTANAATFRTDIVDKLFEYPLLNIFTKSSDKITLDGTLIRNLHFLIGHGGFFMFNFINSWVVVLIFGFVLRRFWKNRLLHFALPAFIVQMISCMFSITRYSINDEYGQYALWSNITGIIAYIFFNVVICHIFVNANDNKAFLIRIGVAIWIVLGLATFIVGDLLLWDTLRFTLIRIYFGLSTIFQLVSYTKALVAFQQGTIKVHPGFPFSPETVSRFLRICIFAIFIALLIAASGITVLQYPATGMTFSVMLVAVSMFGEMDFMHDSRNERELSDNSSNSDSRTKPTEESDISEDNSSNSDGSTKSIEESDSGEDELASLPEV